MASNNSPFSLNDSLLQHFDAALESSPEIIQANDMIEAIKSNRTRYESKESINEGGMKYIIDTYDSLTEREVATAIMKDTSNKQSIINFINEARITAMLEHPNIVPVHDLGVTEDGAPYFTMKLLGGENLQDIISKLDNGNPEYLQVYNKSTLLEIFLKICDAVSFAHSKGIIHLDLKPANIQVNEYGEVLVCDWGLARFLKDEAKNPTINERIDISKLQELSIELTEDGLFKGSPGYTAPEQISSTAGKRSTKTDIYSLGCILYALLTYKIPLSGPVDQILKKTLTGDIVSPKERNPECVISDSLNAVTMKALSLEQESRYHSVSDLGADIRSFTHGFATKAEDAGFTTQLVLLFRRNKRLCFSIALFFVIVSITTTSFMINLQEEKQVAQTAQIKAEQLQIKQMQARAEAEHSLELFQQAEQKRTHLRHDSALTILEYALQEFKQKKYFKVGKLLEKAIELNPHNDAIRLHYARHLFGNHLFQNTIETLESIKIQNKEDLHLLALAQRCLKLMPKHKFINSPEILKILTELKNSKELSKHYRHFLISFTKSYPLNDRIDFARRHLQTMFKGNEFRFDLKQLPNNQLSLSLADNAGIYDIISLTNLPIANLDLSHTDVTNLNPLMKMPLKKLDISYTHVSDISPIKHAPIEELNLYSTNVRSVITLKNHRLKKLTLSGKWTELTSLIGSKTIQEIHVPQGSYSSEVYERLNQDLPLITIKEP